MVNMLSIQLIPFSDKLYNYERWELKIFFQNFPILNSNLSPWSLIEQILLFSKQKFFTYLKLPLLSHLPLHL
jgi:hypothetical protein